MNTLCDCGRPTRDGAYICETCADDLSKALGDIAWLDNELETTITLQKGIDYRAIGGGKGGSKSHPQPINWKAADARSHLRALLGAWATWCDNNRIRHQSPDSHLPIGDLLALSRWLLWRVDGLTLHDEGSRAVQEITEAVTHCHHLIDRPPDRQYLGDCTTCGEGRIYGRPNVTWATCDTCGARVDADELRRRLLEQLQDRLCTASEIAKLSTYLGLKADRDSVRKRINQWAARGSIAVHPSITDEVTFRFGEVYARLAQAEYAKPGAA